MNILILDDDAQKLSAISGYVKSMNHKCRVAFNVSEMKEYVSKNKYDIVLVDLVVPVDTEEIMRGKSRTVKMGMMRSDI